MKLDKLALFDQDISNDKKSYDNFRLWKIDIFQAFLGPFIKIHQFTLFGGSIFSSLKTVAPMEIISQGNFK